jgi:hypothetical protein
MNKLFAEGGVMQEGGTVDPVSGNDVPPGAMAEEVRDDIPAQLSEGEFVFPADVVRFYGLEKLMMMRDKAKKGLQRMNEIGQMGNAEEVPDGEALFGGEGMDDDAFSSEIDSIMAEDSGGETREYAKGGDVRKYAPGGYVGGEENAQLYRDAPIKGFEMVPMTNDAGQTIYIPFINGVAQLSIPSGYKVKTAGAVETPVAEKPTEAAPTTGGDGGGDDGGGGGDSDDTGGGGSTSNAPGVQGSFSPVTGQQVGIASMALGMMGLPGMTIANLGKNSIAEAINTIGYNSAVSNNMSVVGEMMGLDPNDPANTAAISAAIDSTPNMGEQTSAPTATVGSTGTGGGAAAAAAAAASAAAAAGMSAAAQGAASQAAASATVGGASAGEAATAGANAAAAADQGDVAEGGAMAAEANNAVGDASDPDGTVGGGGGGGGAGVCFLTTAAVEHMGHNDDGQLLNTLRDFRDT